MQSVNKQTTAMSGKIDVPIICIDDDDDDDDVKIDKGYKDFLDHLTEDSSFGPLFISNESDFNRPLRYGADNGKSETRRFDTFSGQSKRSNENPMKNKQRKGEISRGLGITKTRENIQRDNRIAERRKRKIAELEAASVSRDVPLTITRGNTQLENKVAQPRKRRVVGLEAARFSRDVPFVRNHKSIPRDGKVGKFSELEDETLVDVPLVRTEEDIQRGNKVSERRNRKAETLRNDVSLVRIEEDNRIAETMVVNETSRDELEAASVSRAVLLVRNHESIPRDGKVGKFSEFEDETLGDVPLVIIEEDIQRDKKVSEVRKRTAETLRRDVFSVRIEEDNRIAETLVVNETSMAVPVELNPANDTSRAELEPARVSRAVPLVRNHESFRRNYRVGKFSELEDETLGDAPLVRIEEDFQRDNKVSEGRKRKAETLSKDFSLVRIEEDDRIAETMVVNETSRAELEAARVSMAAPLVRNYESIPRDGKVGKLSELEDETLGDVPLVIIEEDIQRDNKVSEGRKRKAETLSKDVSLVRIEEDNRIAEAMVVNETSKAVPVELNPVNETSRDELEGARVSRAVPLVRNHESFRRNYKVGKISELEDETLGDAPLVRIEEDSQRGNKVSEERRKKAKTLRKDVSLVRIEEDDRIAETLVVNETLKAVPMELNPVNETSRNVQMSQTNKGVFAGRRKNHEKSVKIVDKDYMSYLTWLVDSLKDFTTKPISNLQKDLSELDPPITDTQKAITMDPEDDLLVEVKVELDPDSWSSDDSDIIAIGDSPFSDGEETPFVTSKSVIIDLDKERSKEDESSCWFRKELMDDLKRPYNEVELSRLHREASIHRRMTRCRELRKGRETDYETDELGKSYLESFDDFNRVYKRVARNDKARALKLLRGFFFYLKNVSHDGAYKPWMDPP